jgi:hypothetical protein
MQLGLRQSHVELIINALQDSMDAEDFPDDDDTVKAWNDLKYFLIRASDNPSAFPPTGKLASSIKKGTAQIKGTSRTPSRTNKRKARQEKRQGWAKQRRKLRAANAKAYNEAVAIQEAEYAEMEAEYEKQKAIFDAEPKFDVYTPDGNRVMSGIPASMVKPAETAEDDMPRAEIVLP